MKKRLIALVMASVMALSLLTGCGGNGGSASTGSSGSAAEYSAENPIKLRLASDAPAEHVATGLNNDLCALVAEKTEGRVTMQYFPSSQLGGSETVYEEMMMGSIDAAQITAPDAMDARLGIAYLPYYALSYEQAATLFAPDSYVGQMMKDICAGHGVRWMGFCLEGFIGMGTTKEPKNLDSADLAADKGIKIRTASMLTLRNCWEDLGYDAITVAYNEVPTAIQTNVVEGWVGGTPNMNYAWVGELLSHMFVNYAHAEATSYMMSQKTLDKLTEEDQALVIAAFEEISAKSFEAAEENERNYMDKLANDYGVVVVEDSMERREEIAAFVREVTWPGLEEMMGADTIQGCRDELAKLG